KKMHRYRQVVGPVGNTHCIIRNTSSELPVACGWSTRCQYSPVTGCPRRRTIQSIPRPAKSCGGRVLNDVNRSVSSCQAFSSGGNSLNVLGWICGMWYDSSEFSSTTFQLHGKSFSHVAECRYAPP